MKRCIKMAMLFLLILMGLSAVSLPICAAQTVTSESEVQGAWADLVSTVPPEIAALLPEGFFESDIEGVGASVGEASTLKSILRVVGEVTGITLTQSLAFLARIVGALLLCATFRAAVGEGKVQWFYYYIAYVWAAERTGK